MAGDDVLRRVATRLDGMVRASDTVARMGGDEFVILVHARDTAVVRGVARRVRTELARPFEVDGGVYAMTASVGMAVAKRSDTPDSLIAAADADMYAAKRRRFEACAA
jgi:diguanylate cyclase (GGDEF)-like protein